MSVLRPMISSLAAKLAAQSSSSPASSLPPRAPTLPSCSRPPSCCAAAVDAINVTDRRGPAWPWIRAPWRLLQRRGFETIVQITSRDRNRIAIQSDLLGAAALGLRNFVFMGGDSTAGGDHPEAKPVFDLTASGLLAAAEALRNGRDFAGNALSGTPELFLGATCNPGAANFDAEVENTRRKIDAGAQMLQTQAVYHARSAATIHRCRETRWCRDSRGSDSAQVRKERAVAECQSSGRGRAGGHGRGHGTGGRRASGARARRRARRRGSCARSQDICQGVHVMAIGWEAEYPEILRSAGVRASAAPAASFRTRRKFGARVDDGRYRGMFDVALHRDCVELGAVTACAAHAHEAILACGTAFPARLAPARIRGRRARTRAAARSPRIHRRRADARPASSH